MEFIIIAGTKEPTITPKTVLIPNARNPNKFAPKAYENDLFFLTAR